MVEPWAVYAGAAVSVAIFISLIITGLELSLRKMKTIALTSWIIAVLVAIISSVAWNKTIHGADHLPLGGIGAGLAIFFTIGYGTIIVWSFVGDLRGRDPDKHKN